MADQMAGEWYARACGLPPIVPPSNAKSALKTVFEYLPVTFFYILLLSLFSMTTKVLMSKNSEQEIWEQ